MIKPLQILLSLTVVIFLGCEKKVSDLEYEKDVMTALFPDLIDEICIDSRMFGPPPLFDSIKSIEENKRKKIEWENTQKAIEKDTCKLIVAFNPQIENSSKDLKEYLEKHFKGTKIFYPKIEADTVYTIDFKNIPLKGKFQLRNISEFPKDRYEFWRTKYDFVFSGVVYFSRIQFDKTKKFGVLNAGFTCERHCGNGFRIYIKNIKDKWVIDEIEGTWVS
ncbi:hypothetical protein ACQKCJ_14820 [Flavobacterium sp. NPDC079362]|uniref:hypothetical protein n=1 Tax=Flavobacterium sp. NPDC079362 TaxID=3390566 RepID=UPI003D01F257